MSEKKIKQRLREITKMYHEEEWIEEEFQHLLDMFTKFINKKE